MKKAQISLEFILLIFGIILIGVIVSSYVANSAGITKFLGNSTYSTKKITYKGFGAINGIENVAISGTTNTTTPNNESSGLVNESNNISGFARILFVGEAPPSNLDYNSYGDIRYTDNVDITTRGGNTLIIKPKGSPDEKYIVYFVDGVVDYPNIEFWAQGKHTLEIYNVKIIPEGIYVKFIVKGIPLPQIITIRDIKYIKGVDGVNFEISGGGKKTDAEIYISNTNISTFDINNLERTSGEIILTIENSEIDNLEGYPDFNNYSGNNPITIIIKNSWINGKYVTYYTKKIE
ncbi:class III signal peptide-containing protein [Methanocaldococcus sp. FS406-22]|uniref:class III signal peptide-containing protein n=1 Tax=Methanocaldococcus sp. (strain FS406-22) TaxID=644281 RepID=UPI00064E44F3|nr:class III signal peptide-containing protein [Methanocaldococcus sp. FS406-22]